MRFCSLGSGSGGNATVVEASQGITQTRLLIDCGFSLREFRRRLGRVGLECHQIDAIFVTHEHGDHVGCAPALAMQLRIPLITSRGTWRAIQPDDFDPRLLRLLRSGESLDCGDLHLQPLSVPHDAQEPLQLRVDDGASRLGVLTDLGSTPSCIDAALANCHAMLLECNHDEDLLRASRYPASLKRRILGSHGHLSNSAAAALLARLRHDGLRTVAAAHLSERNNTPELARAALAGVMGLSPQAIPVADPLDGLDWLTV